MALTDPEVRVLAALIEKEAAVPESYPLTLNALRLACNQATNRRPVVSYDDRTVEAALLSLKSVGLSASSIRRTAGARPAIATPPTSDGVCRPASCSSCRRSPCVEPQTVAEIRARVERLLPADESSTIEELLDALAARSPEPLAVRLGSASRRARRPVGGGDRFGSHRDRRRP